MTKILITGAAGFIGSAVYRRISYIFPNASYVYLLDCFDSVHDSYGDIENLSLSFESSENNCSSAILPMSLLSKNLPDILDDLKPDIVIHLGAKSNTRGVSVFETLDHNITPFRHILRYCNLNNAKLFYASSAATYGSAKHASNSEITCEVSPNTPYSWSKYSMDTLARQALEENPDLKIYGLRFFNVFGYRENSKKSTASLPCQWFECLVENTSPTLFDDSESTFRDFIWVEDVIEMMTLISRSGKSGIYDLGSGTSTSFLELFNICSGILSSDVQPNIIPNPYPIELYQKYTCADTSWFPPGFETRPLKEALNIYYQQLSKAKK